MKDVSLYESFLAELRKKIPQGAKLTNTLVDMLYIEREAVSYVFFARSAGTIDEYRHIGR